MWQIDDFFFEKSNMWPKHCAMYLKSKHGVIIWNKHFCKMLWTDEMFIRLSNLSITQVTYKLAILLWQSFDVLGIQISILRFLRQKWTTGGESTIILKWLFFAHLSSSLGGKERFLSIFRRTEMIFPRKKWQFPRIWSPPYFSPSLLFICNDAFSAPPSLLLHDLELLGMGLCLNYEFKCI